MNTPSLQTTFDPQDWNYHGYWKASIFPQYFWFSSFNTQKVKDVGLDLTESGYIVFGNGYYLTKRAVSTEVENIMRHQIASENMPIIRAMRSQAIKCSQDAVAFAEALISPLTPTDFENVIAYAKGATLFWALSAGYFAPISDKLLEEVFEEEKMDLHLIPQVIAQQDTLLTDMYRSLLVLKEQFVMKNLPLTEASLVADPELAKQVEDHRRNYEWVQIVGWIGPTLSTSEVLGMIQKFQETKTVSLDRSTYSSTLRNALEILETSWFIRQVSVEYFSKFSFKIIPLLQEYAETNGLTYRDLLNLTPPELLLHIRKELKGEGLQKLLQERKEGNWLAYMHRDQEIVTENAEDIEYITKLMVPKADPDQKIVKGQVGNKGLAQGYVRIVLNSDDFGKMQPGDILVSTMTTPDFVVLMQQAAAFITDNGGMLCHAAIIARELNKPCVIGTKIATQILKDGDLVEVDATNGVVKIL